MKPSSFSRIIQNLYIEIEHLKEKIFAFDKNIIQALEKIREDFIVQCERQDIEQVKKIVEHM